MAIANYKPTSEPQVKPSTPQVQPRDYKSIIYDDNNVPLSSLIAYVEGAPWYVDYYKQVVAEGNDLREIDPSQDAVYQQYEKVLGLELRVNTPLTTGYNQDTGMTSSTGSAIIYPFFLPNVSDYFVTDAGDTRKGLFRITSVERKTFNRDSAFAIDYEMVGYIEVLEALYGDLTSKVIRTYHFSKDRLVEGLSPILKTDDYQSISKLSLLYKDIVSYYFKTFFNRKYMTLVIPGQDYGIYDSFLMSYLLKIVDSFDAYEIRLIKQITIDNDPYMSQPQFWDLMLHKDYDSLSLCNQQMKLVNKELFNNNTYLHGLAYTNINKIVYPVNPDLTLNVANTSDPKIIAFEDLVEVNNRTGSLADLLIGQYIETNASYPLIKLITEDDYYVLSSQFYNEESNLSVLEILVKDYMKLQTLDLNMLLALCSKYKTWGRLEQFYYGPILLTLIKEAKRSTY